MKQECKDNATWQMNYAVAHFLMLGLGIIVGLFFEQYLLGVIFLAISAGLYFWAAHAQKKHEKWHAKQDKTTVKYYTKEDENE